MGIHPDSSVLVGEFGRAGDIPNACIDLSESGCGSGANLLDCVPVLRNQVHPEVRYEVTQLTLRGF